MDVPLLAGRPERARVMLAAVLAGGSLVAHAATLVINLSGGAPGNVLLAAVGTLVSLGALALCRRPRVVLALGVALMTAWVLLDISEGVHSQAGVTIWLVFDVLMLVLLLYAALPARVATLGSVLAYVVFVSAALAAGSVDILALILMGLIVALIIYLTQHGHAISMAQGRAEAALWQAEHDGLTGLLNRQALDARLGRCAQRAGDQGALLFLDLDHFKAVNDRLGHQAGDQALTEFAEVLRREAGDGAKVGRWGGDEFMVILPGAGGRRARGVAERIVQGMRTDIAPRYPGLSVTCGVTLWQGPQRPDLLLAAADEQLYRGKQRGRNTVVAPDGGGGDTG